MRQDGGGAAITGVIDFLYRDKETGELVVVDYKTGAFHEEYKWQLSVYGHCAGTRGLMVFRPEAADAHALAREGLSGIRGRLG